MQKVNLTNLQICQGMSAYITKHKKETVFIRNKYIEKLVSRNHFMIFFTFTKLSASRTEHSPNC